MSLKNVKKVGSFCAWIDLLGYGTPFYDCNWNLSSPEAIKNIKRVNDLKELVTQIYLPFGEMLLVLNDGFVRNFDIPANNVHNIIGWLIHVLETFKNINEFDIKNGFYGARGVLSYGERFQYIDCDTVGKDAFILTSEEKRNLYREQKIIYTPSELQMNTAFSKAFIIEESGSNRGVKKNKINIDECMLIKLADVINTIGYDEFGLTEEDYNKNGSCIYKYHASINTEKREFLVEAMTGDAKWIYFRIEFEDIVEYDNEKKSLSTKLYIPCKIESSLFSPYDHIEIIL